MINSSMPQTWDIEEHHMDDYYYLRAHRFFCFSILGNRPTQITQQVKQHIAIFVGGYLFNSSIMRNTLNRHKTSKPCLTRSHINTLLVNLIDLCCSFQKWTAHLPLLSVWTRENMEDNSITKVKKCSKNSTPQHLNVLPSLGSSIGKMGKGRVGL